jgi:hypothetical protein
MGHRLHALLIGIDCYLPNRLPNGGSYSSLSGCVKDVVCVENFLKEKLGLDSKHILKLTASNSQSIEPLEAYSKWPTYENIVKAFQRLSNIASPGDHVYIHYSGHGGRITAKFPELKSNGLDECLVPLNIGKSEARYLRDIELAFLLNKMVKQDLIITVVLDSCHSGGMVRGNSGIKVRGINEIDQTKRSSKSLVASDTDLVKIWKSLVPPTRALKLDSGWLPEPKGYVLLSACRPSESAYEHAFDGKEWNGVFTYWLLDSFKQTNSTPTYKLIQNRVVAKVRSQFQKQTPLLQGEGDRKVFGSDFVQSRSAINVMQVDLVNQRVLLNTGQAQAVQKGAQFMIYDSGKIDSLHTDGKLALVEITELGTTESWARVIEKFKQIPIKQGYQAALLGFNNIRLYRKIHLVHQEVLPSAIDQELAFEQVKDSLKNSGKGFLELVESDESTDYNVTVNNNGEYEIWDSTGQKIPNLRPAIRCSDPSAADYLTERLVHLTKFHNILSLNNDRSPLSGEFVFKLVGMQSNYNPADPPKPLPFSNPENMPTLSPDEWVFARIQNNSSEVLNVAILNLQPDWGITQIYPSKQDSCFHPLDPGEELLLPLKAHLPLGYTSIKDVIKVFATVNSTDFRWLELPALDQQCVRGVIASYRPQNALEELLASVAPPILNKRHLSTVTYSSCEWVTVQLEILVRI